MEVYERHVPAHQQLDTIRTGPHSSLNERSNRGVPGQRAGRLSYTAGTQSLKDMAASLHANGPPTDAAEPPLRRMGRSQSLQTNGQREQRQRLLSAQMRRASIASGEVPNKEGSSSGGSGSGEAREGAGSRLGGQGSRRSMPAFPSPSERAAAERARLMERRGSNGYRQNFRSGTVSSTNKMKSSHISQLARRQSMGTVREGQQLSWAGSSSTLQSHQPNWANQSETACGSGSAGSGSGNGSGALQKWERVASFGGSSGAVGSAPSLPLDRCYRRGISQTPTARGAGSSTTASGALSRDFRARMFRKTHSQQDDARIAQGQTAAAAGNGNREESAQNEDEPGLPRESQAGCDEEEEEEDGLPESSVAFDELGDDGKPPGFDGTGAAGGAAGCLVRCAVVSRGGRSRGEWKKENQDTFFMQVGAGDEWAAVGVYDGHGCNGRELSVGVRKLMAKQLRNVDRSKPIPYDKKTFLKGIFREVEQQLRTSLPNVDKGNSGSCALLMLCSRSCISTAWCGDSRAVLGYREEGLLGHTWAALPLSNDHKPEAPKEYNRIVAANGRVEKMLVDENGTRGGPYRVFLRYAWQPGLAISRTFGDLLAHEVGVICTPDVKTHKMQPRDRFVVLGSDGVWDVLSNEEAVGIVGRLLDRYGDADGYDHPDGRVITRASEELATIAQRRWYNEYGGNACDDVTAMVVMLNHGR